MDLDHFLHGRLPFFLFGLIDHVGVVDAAHGLVRRNGDNFELIYLPKLIGFRLGRAGHAGQLLVELEEVLQRHCRQRLRLFLDLDAFARVLGLDRLVQPVRPLPADHQTAREFVDDDDAQFVRLGMAHHRIFFILFV